MFHLGQKIVCVGQITPTHYQETLPVVGQTYVVRDLFENGIGKGVRLNEILNKENLYTDGLMEAAFNIKKFRPVIEKSTDAGMAVLNEILKRETVDDHRSSVAKTNAG